MANLQACFEFSPDFRLLINCAFSLSDVLIFIIVSSRENLMKQHCYLVHLMLVDLKVCEKKLVRQKFIISRKIHKKFNLNRF